MTWLWPVLTLAAVAAVAWFVGRELATSTGGEVERRFVCPVTGEPVAATFTSDFFDPRHYRDVTRCSAFAGRALACGKDCLALAKPALERQDAARAALLH